MSYKIKPCQAVEFECNEKCATKECRSKFYHMHTDEFGKVVSTSGSWIIKASEDTAMKPIADNENLYCSKCIEKSRK